MYLITPDQKNFLRVFDREIAERLADNIGGTIMTTIKPTEITVISYNGEDIHLAIFKRDEGVTYAHMNKLEYTTNFGETIDGKYYHFGEKVVLRVNKTDFPEIKRKNS